MRKKKVGAIAIKSFALLAVLVVMLVAVLATTHHAMMAQDAATPYPKMAPINQYLMTDQGAEIALARSAAPESIARDAEVLVLGRHGFETAVKGKNGFVCIVGRSWTSTTDAEFWNPKVRVPMCVNSAAAHSYLLRITKITELALAGRTLAQVNEAMAAAVAKKELPPMESGAMCYMMGKEGYGGDGVEHWPSHLMFFYSNTGAATWGANLSGSPVIAVEDPQEQLTQFVIPVQRWSDGTEVLPAPTHVHPRALCVTTIGWFQASMTDIHKTIEAVWKIESTLLIAGITRVTHDIGIAEELAQDALVTALDPPHKQKSYFQDALPQIAQSMARTKIY